MKIGLVLGSGSARGIASVGVIKHLEQIGIKPDIICGSSMGALIGGAYASGMDINEMEKIATRMKNYKDVIKLIDINNPFNSLIKGEKIKQFLKTIIKKDKIENFYKKFSCNATDIMHGKEVIFKKGNAINAIRASISIPGIFRPVKYKKTFLVDGGLLNPVPIDIAKQMGADVIIAVDVNSKMKLNNKKNLNLFSTIENAIEIMEIQLSKKYEINYKNTIVLKPNISSIGRYDFFKAKKIITLGYKESKRNEKKIKKLIFQSN